MASAYGIKRQEKEVPEPEHFGSGTSRAHHAAVRRGWWELLSERAYGLHIRT